MPSTPQPPVAEHPVGDPPTDAHRAAAGAPITATSGETPTERPRRTFSVRVTAAIGAGALVVGAALGMLTGGLVGPGGPGGGPGGAPPGTSAGQDGSGSAQQDTAPGDTGTGAGAATGT